MNIPEDLLYTATHEWVRMEADVATVGISDHAQNELGDVVFLELPQEGRQLAENEPAAVIESVKAASDIYAPLAGTVLEVNNAALADPSSINRSPYTDGWLFKMRVTGEPDRSKLLSAADYSGRLGV